MSTIVLCSNTSTSLRQIRSLRGLSPLLGLRHCSFYQEGDKVICFLNMKSKCIFFQLIVYAMQKRCDLFTSKLCFIKLGFFFTQLVFVLKKFMVSMHSRVFILLDSACSYAMKCFHMMKATKTTMI